MKFHVLALDYDGTIAKNGTVNEETLKALEGAKKSGRRLILNTGRQLEELLSIFDRADLFEWIVAENGALLYTPQTRKKTLLAEPPPAEFVELLNKRGVHPLSTGHVVVATWTPHETVVLETIKDLGLDLQVIFNKDAVMCLPSGVNKASGLKAALKEMKLSERNLMAFGDAENDLSFFKLAECAVATGNALESVKEKAEYVAEKTHGEGVKEAIDLLLEGEEVFLEASSKRHTITIGDHLDGSPFTLTPYRRNVLVAGSSGAGKSTLATSFIEELIKEKYQFCLFDPEGDYGEIDGTTTIGDPSHPPGADEFSRILEEPGHNVIVNMTGVPLDDRPPLFLKFLSRITELRAATGRPHWLIIDEAHHVLPSDYEQAESAVPKLPTSTLFITMNPEDLLLSAVEPLETVIGVGKEAEAVFSKWKELSQLSTSTTTSNLEELQTGEVYVWDIKKDDIKKMKVRPSSYQRERHRKKYAEGELPDDRSFYFKGSEGKLNLKAHNLMLFLRIGEGVDEDTWNFHLRAKDYSQWIANSLKDSELAEKVRMIEEENEKKEESFIKIKDIIEERYTAPVKSLATEKEGAG